MNFKIKNLIKYIFSTLLILSLSVSLIGQSNLRTNETKIVDALNQLPAQNQKLYNRLMQDIYSTGEDGINLLLEMLTKKNDSYIQVQYAINGVVDYISDPTIKDNNKEMVVNSIQNILKKYKEGQLPKNIEIEEFLTKQLKTLGYIVKAQECQPIYTVSQVKKDLKNGKKLVKKENNPQNRANLYQSLSRYITTIGNDGARKEILKAVSSEDREYRFAALNSINQKDADKINNEIEIILPKININGQIDVLYYLGELKEPQFLDYIIPFINNENIELVSAAVKSSTSIGTEQSILAIAELLKSNDSKRIILAQEYLKCIKGDVASASVNTIKSTTPSGHAAILDIIKTRKANTYKELIYRSLNSENEIVKLAAYQALAETSLIEDLKTLYRLLETTDTEYVKYVQEAIYNSMISLSDGEKFSILTEKREEVSEGIKPLYNRLIIKSANIEQLYNLCNTTNDNDIFEESFSAYISKVNTSKQPGAQSLLQLRKIMELATNDNQKRLVLNSVAKTNTFLGIIFAGKYIEEKQLSQSAANTIRLIAINNKDFHSLEVTNLLRRCLDIIEGQDAIYEKSSIQKYLSELPSEEGFVSLFNGKDLTGWKGLVKNPIIRGKLSGKELEKEQVKADELMRKGWIVEDGKIVFTGKGDNLCTVKEYGDFELYVDWLLYPEGPQADAGIYLRGAPQVQIWDTSRVHVGAQVGSGGLYNNKKNQAIPLCVADNPLGEWNSFCIKMVGERVTVLLNGVLVVDNVIMENYWDRSLPIFLKEQIELQAHGSKVAYRDLYIKELQSVEPVKLSPQEEKEGFEILFDGTSMHSFKGNTTDYLTEDGCIAVRPTGQGFGNLYTVEQYEDFIFRFEFKLTPGANNGVGIRTPDEGDAAYVGMEIQVLDHYNSIYQPGLRDYQYHGSVYGIIPAKERDALKPVGQWNEEEIYIKGSYVRVTLNGKVITEGDIVEATKNGTYDGNDHPGLKNKSGYIGFLGHGSELWYRNIRIKKL